MILPHEYAKSFQDHRKDKRMVHQQKILKNRLKSLLPNDASIKLFYAQNGENTNESSLLKLYRFDEIPKSQYQKILSNPLYFLSNERNLRMFRFYLAKNGYSENRVQGYVNQSGVKNRKASLISNGQKLMQYQFFDKTKVNYQQPWKYIQRTIKKMEDSTKGAHRKLSVELNTINRTKSSDRIALNQQSKKQPENKMNPQKDIYSPKLCKNFSTSFIFKIKERQQNVNRIKEDLFGKQLKKINASRINFYSKILESELRMKKMIEKDTQERKKIKSMILIKTQRYQSQRKINDQMGPQMKRHLSQLKKVCVRTVCQQTQSLSNIKQNTNPVQKSSKKFVPVTKLKEIKVKQRRQILKNMLQKRLGIQEFPK